MSGLIRPDGAPGRILEAVRSRRLSAVASWEHTEEIVGVLSRPWLARYGVGPDDVREVLALLAPALPYVEVDAPVRDPADAPVIAGAMAGRAEAIVTGDADFVDDDALMDWLAERGIEVLTPRELLRRLDAG